MNVEAATLADVDLTDLDNFAHGFPHELFALHRREAPVWWHEPTAHTPDGEGFWSVATYAETLDGAARPRRRTPRSAAATASTAARCSRTSTSPGSCST